MASVVAHTLFFSEDAITLESELDKAFADRRVNLVNQRREFFLATPTKVSEGAWPSRNDAAGAVVGTRAGSAGPCQRSGTGGCWAPASGYGADARI